MLYSSWGRVLILVILNLLLKQLRSRFNSFYGVQILEYKVLSVTDFYFYFFCALISILSYLLPSILPLFCFVHQNTRTKSPHYVNFIWHTIVEMLIRLKHISVY